MLLGSGERLFDDLPDVGDGYEVVDVTASPAVVHVRLEKRGASRQAP